MAVFGSKTVRLEYLVDYDPGIPAVGLRFDGHVWRHERNIENELKTRSLEVFEDVGEGTAGVLGVCRERSQSSSEREYRKFSPHDDSEIGMADSGVRIWYGAFPNAARKQLRATEMETLMEIRYALVKEFPELGYDDAVAKATDALADEGFGVLTEIDVKSTLKKKLGIDFRRYIILGACNPQLAHQAMSGEPFIGVLLPCNVVVMEREGGGTIVSALKPSAAFSLVDNPDVAPIAEEVEDRLRRVLERLV